MSALTADLGLFVSGLTLQAIPVDGQNVAKMGFTDCFGVMVAGFRDPMIAVIDRALSGSDASSLAPLLPSKELRNVEDAALVNGIAAHVLDFDDVTLDGHPSAVLVPAILAQGYASGSTGAEILTAYVAGYEVWAELLMREPVPLHQKGWHPTAVRGAVAAAAACAKLRRLDPSSVSTAMAIAASMAGGLVANFGTFTKAFQVGRAAQSGVIAARLAEIGLTASPDALEHQSGFLAAFSPRGEADLAMPFQSKPKEWHIVRQGLNLKRYPICYATHRAIDAATGLVERHNIKSEDVEQIRVFTGRTQMLMLRNDRPKTALEAKFSMEFAMAASVVARNVGLAQLTDEFVLDPSVQALIPRVSCETTEETMEGSAFAPSESVKISTVQGRILSSEMIIHAKGSWPRPLSSDELWRKFADCLGDSFAHAAKLQTFDRFQNLERQGTPSDLMAF